MCCCVSVCSDWLCPWCVTGAPMRKLLVEQRRPNKWAAVIINCVQSCSSFKSSSIVVACFAVKKRFTPVNVLKVYTQHECHPSVTARQNTAPVTLNHERPPPLTARSTPPRPTPPHSATFAFPLWHIYLCLSARWALQCGNEIPVALPRRGHAALALAVCRAPPFVSDATSAFFVD